MQIKDILPWAQKDHTPEAQSNKDHPITILQNELNQVFDRFKNRFEQKIEAIEWPWNGGDAKSDIVETDKTIEVSVELPGMDMEDIEVSITNDVLAIKGEKKVERQEEKKGYYLSERQYGAVYRTIPLPAGIDGKKAEASFKNGVLTVTLPQTLNTKAEVKRIEVKST